jgi:hypothetical protein
VNDEPVRPCVVVPEYAVPIVALEVSVTAVISYGCDSEPNLIHQPTWFGWNEVPLWSLWNTVVAPKATLQLVPVLTRRVVPVSVSSLRYSQSLIFRICWYR